MKKKLLVALAVSAISATSALAAVTFTDPGKGVVGSVHDMNMMQAAGNNILPDNQGRVCAFCHTPHHAIDTSDPVNLAADYLPLWSHNLTALDNTTVLQYASYTFDAGLNTPVQPLYGPSRLCMSCHDGAIAPDQHYGGTSPSSNATFGNNEFTGDMPIGIGKDGKLNRTHPIGFKLSEAVANDMNGSNFGLSGFQPGVETGEAIYVGNPRGKKIKSQLYDGYMTCATCHDVHNRDNATNGGQTDSNHKDGIARNYLVFSPQAGSQLCISCHDK